MRPDKESLKLVRIAEKLIRRSVNVFVSPQVKFEATKLPSSVGCAMFTERIMWLWPSLLSHFAGHDAVS